MKKESEELKNKYPQNSLGEHLEKTYSEKCCENKDIDFHTERTAVGNKITKVFCSNCGNVFKK